MAESSFFLPSRVNTLFKGMGSIVLQPEPESQNYCLSAVDHQANVKPSQPAFSLLICKMMMTLAFNPESCYVD